MSAITPTGAAAGPNAVGPRWGIRIAHLLVILAGLAVFAYPFTVGASPTVTCRGVVMQPGDTCAKAGEAADPQTYAQRAADYRNARPVIAVAGVLVAGFGVVLLRGELRRPRR